MAYIFGSIWDRRNRNALNELSKSVEIQGKSIQDLVAEGQLTPTQYAQLITVINGLIKSGHVDKMDLTSDFRNEIEGLREKNVPIGLNDADSELLAAIEGGSGTSFNLLSIPRDKSVSPAKTTFIRQSKNLFNKSTANIDYYLAPADGGLRASTTYATSDYIGVNAGGKLTLNKKQGIAFYKEDLSFLSFIASDVYGTPGNPYTFTIPANATYLRFTLLKGDLDSVQLELGEAVSEYEEFNVELDDEISVNAEKIRGFISDLQIGFLEQTPNLLNPNEVTTGGFIDHATGGIISSPLGYGYSSYIEVDPLTTYTLNLKRSIAFYDINKTFISGVASAGGGTTDSIYTFNTPSNARYIRVTVLLDNLERTMFNKGGYKGYQHFGKALPKEYMDSEVIEDIENLKKGTRERKTIKILSFGNSFSQDAHQWLPYISASAGVDVILGNLSIAGQSLQGQHEQITGNLTNYTYFKKTTIDGNVSNQILGDNNSYLDALLDEDWDIITLQQSSDLSGVTSSYQPYLNNIINTLRSDSTNPDVRFALHLTWAYSSDSVHGSFPTYGNDVMQMYNQITDSNMDALISSDIDILIPTGTAVQNARANSYLNDVGTELTRDGHHLNYGIGRYIAGLTFFDVLIAKQNNIDILTDVSFYPTNADQSVIVDGVDSSAPLAYLAKLAVKNAVVRPFKVTEF